PRLPKEDARAWRRRSLRAYRPRSWSGYPTLRGSLARFSAVGYRDELLQLGCRRAAVQRLGAQPDAVLQRLGLARHDEGCSRIEQRYVAIGARLAIEHTLQRDCIGIGIAALQSLAAGAAEAGFFRRHLEAADTAVLECCDKGRAGERDLVEAVGAVHDPD